ncbi:hypothetical protein [Egbenema bharatensis]|uniref:hypothetical protein n=1 Tax=Egbenema bharatensis TaxID=3463334 RepID=UPI003A863E3E
MFGVGGVGKTTFLQQLASHCVWQQHGFEPNSLVIVLVSCLSVAPPFTAANFWFEVLNLLHDELEDLPQVQAEVNTLLEQETFNVRGIRQILRRLSKYNRRLVLLIDDYEEALQPHEHYTKAEIDLFLTEQRSLAYSSTQRQQISLVVSTSRPLGEFSFPPRPDRSPWFNHYLFLPLHSFSRSEAEALLNPISMPATLQDTVWEATGGNPTLLQLAGSLLYTELRNGRLLEPNQFVQAFVHQAEPFFQYIWTELSEMEQMLLIVIILRNLAHRLQGKQAVDLYKIDRLLSQRERELLYLVDWGILTKGSHSGEMSYTFCSSMLEWWMLKQIQESHSERLPDRSITAFSFVDADPANDMSGIFRLVWQYVDLNVSISEWMNYALGRSNR